MRADAHIRPYEHLRIPVGRGQGVSFSSFCTFFMLRNTLE